MTGKLRHGEKGARFRAGLHASAAQTAFVGKTGLNEPLGGDLRGTDRHHAAAAARLLGRIDKARWVLAWWIFRD